MIDWNQIKAVFLDMDGTLLDLHFDNHFWLEFLPKYYASQNKITIEESKSTLMSRYQAKQGQLDWYCVDYWSRTLGVNIIDLKQNLKHKISLRPSVLDFLSSLKDKNKRIVLLTNAHRDTLNLKMTEVPIGHFFDRMISSHDIGLPKESLDFWPALQKTESFALENSLLIDDSKAVLESAKRYGFKYLLGISLPDLKAPPNPAKSFVTLDDFKQII